MKILDKRYGELEELLTEAHEDNDDPHEYIDVLKEQLNNANQVRSELLTSSAELTEKISTCDRQLEEVKIGLMTSLNLQSQYEADQKRLDFQLDAAKYHLNHNQVYTCQFCHSEVTGNQELIADSALIEQEKGKLVELIADVSRNIEYLSTLKVELEGQKISLSTQYDLLVARLESELNPVLKDLQEKIDAFVKVEDLLAEKSQIEQLRERFLVTLSGSDEEEEKRENYDPYEEFEPSFYSTMTNLIQDILGACQFPSASKSAFEKTTFDIRIKNADKKDTEGKGYCAYLNTVNSLSFHRFLNENSVHAPGWILIDTPFHGFDEGESSELRNGIMRYMLSQALEQQIIIIENSNHFNELSFGDGYNEIVFTHNKSEGRYGFLDGVFDVSEDERK